ncbi:LOW QUALITY PROTEIN: N-terminal acetyltransferase B complex auxiliary subunit NAA25 [Dioscorea cayenensis subsp. rotundata]|uniref:LOW QUALITY PROTEIN: N-terminal acetyltransferase B complex auxiliary subunit NAA25 n=1 Tax=Dioscorea cayennensis subsp. rotundata TaxID=55577 RepID=A0AB40BM37_DIOCR|nr:LOW QUALITY PROTEIN: N-terminal acetyltransferase B complex auxiliary subunit NAA25 [Dioscorea cayenensis subsp. rotundata]
MASKYGLAGGIPERRVRPIWDAIDSRQYKNALKLCVGLLAKHPNSPYALALKALILERMGKPDEAMSVCLNAKDLLYSSTAVHVDDLTLSTLQIVFQRLDRLDLATSCYEHACAKYPNNLEIMMGLFNCYVREYSYVKQQQIAIKMYKIVGEERFLLWAVCSIQLQAISSNGGDKLLPLAEGLLKKHIASHSLHEPEALHIYISILEQQGKYETALEVISGNLGSLIGIEVDKLRIQGRLLARARDFAAGAEKFQRVLELCSDDWDAFLNYLGCLLEDDINWSKASVTDQIKLSNSVDFQNCKLSTLTEEVFNFRLSTALSFVQNLQMKGYNDCVRCPYLATIEIERRRRLNGKADDFKLMEVLLNYFNRFGHLSCFTSDVESSLHILTSDERNELLEAFGKSSESSSTISTKAIGSAITIFKIQELFDCASCFPVTDLETIAMKMVDMYCKSLYLSRELDPQENMHGEELLSTVCNVLVHLFWRTRCLSYLLVAILVLEFGSNIRRYVWQYKILLLHLYSHFGALPLSYEWYGTLDVKNILLETVSHHILPQMLRSPLWSETADLLKEYIKFMDDYFNEAADLTFLAYRHRNYSKVIEFVQFKERLQHSYQYLMARMDASILQMKQKTDKLEDVEFILENVKHGLQFLELSNEAELKLLAFNEDFQTRPWWSPTSSINYLLETFEEGTAHRREQKHQVDMRECVARKAIEWKSLLPRLVYLSIQVASSFLKENIELNGSVSDIDYTSEFKCLLERYARNLGLSFEDATEAIVGISEGKKSFKEYDLEMVHLINFAVFVNAFNLCTHHLEPGVGHQQSSWHIVNSLVEKCISEELMHAQPIFTSPGNNLPILVDLVTESISWHILVIQSCLRSMIPSGKKKKKPSATDQLNLPQLQPVHASIQCLTNSIQDVQTWLEGQVNKPEDESLDTLLSHLQSGDTEQGPYQICRILEETATESNPELGERISGALQCWNSANVIRKLVAAQHRSVTEFHCMCASKLRLLESFKQLI